MTATLLLAGSIATQAVSIAAMRSAEGLRRVRWVLVAFVAMAVSVLLMSRAIVLGMSLAAGYGIWTGAGIALAAVTGAVVFRDRLARPHVVGLVLILAGVLLVHSG